MTNVSRLLKDCVNFILGQRNDTGFQDTSMGRCSGREGDLVMDVWFTHKNRGPGKQTKDTRHRLLIFELLNVGV